MSQGQPKGWELVWGSIAGGEKAAPGLQGYFSDGSWVGDVAQALRKNQQLL